MSRVRRIGFPASLGVKHLSNYLSHQELQTEELAMLVEFDALCKRKGLRYSLYGGTLLGAVRHKGFIPWDDDIDLAMPRPDFERFIELGRRGLLPEGYKLAPFSGNWKCPVFIKLLNTKIAIDAHYENGVGSLWLDILPVDGAPNGPNELDGLYREASRIRRLIMFCKADPRQGKTSLKRMLKPALVPLVNAIGLLGRMATRLDSLGKQLAFGETPWVAAVTWGLYGSGERYPVTGWDEMVLLEFEGREFPAIGCWDEYLHGIYSDYMQLPPEDERFTHEMKAWRIDQ